MRDWSKIYKYSERAEHYLRRQWGEPVTNENPDLPGDDLEKRLTERLSSPDYLCRKLKEQQQFDPEAAFLILKRRIRRRRLLWGGGVAASVAVMLGCWVLFRELPGTVTSSLSVNVSFMPGERKATLTLSDGQVILLGDSLLAPIKTEEGILQVDSAQISCVGVEGKNKAESAYNTLFIPRGGEYRLALPDGTQVWLNSETELRFPVSFGGEKREVYLKGEAYFDVKHDAGKPFIVHTGVGNIRVLGTAFNVSTYHTGEIVATLEKGSIAFTEGRSKEVLIKPGEQLTYAQGQQSPRVREVNTRLYTAWKDHLFCFEEQRLEQVMEILGRWYDFQVVFESDDLREREFSGTLDKYSDVKPLLELFELGARIRFDIRGDTIVVKK